MPKIVRLWRVTPNAHTSDVRSQNAAYAYLQVADFRFWKTPRMESSEGDKVVQTEKAVQRSVPKIVGASTHFAKAKERYFQIPPEKHEGMSEKESGGPEPPKVRGGVGF